MVAMVAKECVSQLWIMIISIVVCLLVSLFVCLLVC